MSLSPDMVETLAEYLEKQQVLFLDIKNDWEGDAFIDFDVQNLKKVLTDFSTC